MNRALLSTLLPALVAVPVSYYITRPTRPVPISPALPMRMTPEPEQNESSSKEYLTSSLITKASHYKDLHRKEMNAEITHWFSIIEPSLVPYVEQISEPFIDELSYIKTMYINPINTSAISKYLFTKRMTDALDCAKTPEELRMVQAIAKYYHLLPEESI